MWAWVDEPIQVLVRKLAASKGISISEYVRQLIIADLDGRSVFTTRLKESSTPTGLDSEEVKKALGLRPPSDIGEEAAHVDG